MSTSNVVQVCAGKQTGKIILCHLIYNIIILKLIVFNQLDIDISETWTLVEWKNESTQFEMLRSLHFFKYFLIRKAFHRWRKSIRSICLESYRNLRCSISIFFSNKSKNPEKNYVGKTFILFSIDTGQ
jgi:hypothetical protein